MPCVPCSFYCSSTLLTGKHYSKVSSYFYKNLKFLLYKYICINNTYSLHGLKLLNKWHHTTVKQLAFFCSIFIFSYESFKHMRKSKGCNKLPCTDNPAS